MHSIRYIPAGAGMRAKGAYDTLNGMTISSWQQALQGAIRDTGTLLEHAALPAASVAVAERAPAQFPVRVPHRFARAMRPGDPDDPLLRQVLPAAGEDEPAAGFGPDPVGESRYQPAPGVLMKYPGRVLLVATGACAIHCRYCFRRHFPYAEGNPARDDWRPALAVIRADPSLHEVILSGGDPLSLPDDRLADLVGLLERVPHLKRLRVHTRMPVVVPERVTNALLALLSGNRLRAVVVVHANHAAELDADAVLALQALGAAGLTVLNQSVLLKGVNDDATVLAALSERLFEAGVLPYYLHMLDPVAGAAHFQVDDARARQIMDELRTRLPGYLVPRLVREEPGELSKTPL